MTHHQTKLVGILNITPDSFSDGGKYMDTKSILEHTGQLIKDGADVIDIGAESTTYDATLLSHKEEWARLEPVLARIIDLAKTHNVKTSLDTRHAKSAAKAIELGIDWINDVSGLADDVMLDTIKDSKASLVLMHSLVVPANKKITIANDKDTILEVKEWTKNKLDALAKKGIEKNRIIFDPGIGFGKTAKQSLEIIKRINEFNELGLKILVGHSRKSFLDGLTNSPFNKRDIETIAASLFMAPFVDYLRIHDVAGHQKALNVANHLLQESA